MHYTSSSSPYQPPNHRNDSHHPPQPIKMPKSLFKRKPKPNHKSLQHHFSESATSSSEPKPPILSKPLPSPASLAQSSWSLLAMTLVMGPLLERIAPLGLLTLEILADWES